MSRSVASPPTEASTWRGNAGDGWGSSSLALATGPSTDAPHPATRAPANPTAAATPRGKPAAAARSGRVMPSSNQIRVSVSMRREARTEIKPARVSVEIAATRPNSRRAVTPGASDCST